MKQKPRWRIFQPVWAKGMWVAYNPLTGVHYFDTHKQAWSYVYDRMQTAARIAEFKKKVQEHKQ